jgi:hypothetical protein
MAMEIASRFDDPPVLGLRQAAEEPVEEIRAGRHAAILQKPAAMIRA